MELVLGLMPQDMGSRCPKCCDRFAQRPVLLAGLLVHEARVCDLALGCGGCAVDFAVREGFEGREPEFVGKGVDPGVAEESDACVVGGGDAGVGFEGAVFALG